MNTKFFALMLLLGGFITAQNNDSLVLRSIYSKALTDAKCYNHLKELCTTIGGRLSGSPEAQKAVEWTYKIMKQSGADTVYLQECMVPHWVRGEKEAAKIIIAKGKEFTVPICALGGSVATPAAGLTAGVIEIKNWDEMPMRANEIKGKIVFYNRPMESTHIHTFHAYGTAVDQRWKGASEAVKYGAVGVVVRSVTLAKDDNPHTGVMKYLDSLQKQIPACAISTNGADTLSALLKNNPGINFYFKMNCKTLHDEKSYNVVAELRGTEHPEEIIVVGGHLDAWDNGDGAHDDGAGIVQSIEVIRLFKMLGIKPKRTIRAVAFMNEENGGRGGAKYAEIAKLKKEKHIAAIESDAGGFSPIGFTMDVAPEVKTKINNYERLFKPYGVHNFSLHGGGADIGPLKEQGVALFGLLPDSQRYFDYHHTAIDTFDKINKRELELGAASMASLVYLLSEYGL